MNDKLLFEVGEIILSGEYLVSPKGQRALRLSSRALDLVRTARQGSYHPKNIDELEFFLRLLDIGAARVVPTQSHSSEIGLCEADPRASVSFIIPHFNDVAGLEKTLASIGEYYRSFCGWRTFEVIVVDDCSKSFTGVVELATKFKEGYLCDRDTGHGRISVLRTDKNSGPAAARNVGAKEATSRVLFFVDCGVKFGPNVAAIVDLVATSTASVAAPRIASDACNKKDRALYLYQSLYFPLDIGPASGSVGRGGPQYVPSTLMVIDSSAFKYHNGFNEGLRYGEDVDLVRRVATSGGRCYYDSTVVATHPPRSSVIKLATQAFQYGSSTAILYTLTGGEIYQFPKGWMVLACLSTTYTHLFSTAKRSLRHHNRLAVEEELREVINERAHSSLSSLRRTFALLDVAFKALLVAGVTWQLGGTKRVFEAVTRADSNTECPTIHRSRQFLTSGTGKPKHNAARRIRYLPLAFGVECGLHIYLSISELLRQTTEHQFAHEARKSKLNSSRKSRPNISRIHRQRVLLLLRVTFVSIAYDLAYSAGVVAGSFRKKTIPISKR